MTALRLIPDKKAPIPELPLLAGCSLTIQNDCSGKVGGDQQCGENLGDLQEPVRREPASRRMLVGQDLPKEPSAQIQQGE